MFFLTNVYERRLNENMRRHALNVKVAPHKPKPSTRGHTTRKDTVHLPKTADPELLNRFLESSHVNDAVVLSAVQPPRPPPTYQQVVKQQLTYELVDADYALDGKPINRESVKKTLPVMVHMPRVRSGSFESNMLTDSDFESTSNISLTA